MKDLVFEAVSLLLDLPDFDENIGTLLANESVSKCLFEYFRYLPEEDRDRFFVFLSRLVTLPEALKPLLGVPPEDIWGDKSHLVPVIVKYRDEFPAVMAALLNTTDPGTRALAQVRILDAAPKFDLVYDSVIASMENRNFATVIPLFRALIKRSGLSLKESDVLGLYALAEGGNDLLGFYSFCCLSMITDDRVWARGYLIEFMDKLRWITRRNVAQILLRSWIGKDKLNDVFWVLFRVLVERFPDSVDDVLYVELIRSLVSRGLVDEFLSMTEGIMEGRPHQEAVILLLMGLGHVKGLADGPLWAGVMDRMKRYIDDGGPLLARFCEMVLGAC
jgi:hypothetical protein